MRKYLVVSILLALAGPLYAQDAAPAAPEPAPADSAEPAAEPLEAGPGDTSDAKKAAGDRVSLDEIRRFVSVFHAVKQAYVEPIDDAQLMRAAIRGLLNDLDPHSAYLDAQQARDFNETANGAYDGLGLEVVQNGDRTLTVIAPIDDTPAARAGIRPGDVIIEIDGQPITADNVDAAVESMRGEPGSEIRLGIVRADLPEPLQLTLKRETIEVASAKARELEPGFAYLRIAMFQNDTAEEARRKLAEVADGKALKGLVLDLRSNPGGLLNASVAAADLFLDRGVIVSTRGRLPYSNSEYKATRGDVLKGAPIVILTDSGTASAAEVLTGALRDNKRALVIGDTSFGKGSVQTVLPVDNGDSIKLTTARYYTPSGVSIQAAGIVPDIAVSSAIELRRGDSRASLRERDLPGHLRGDQEAEGAAAGAASSASPPQDYVLDEALNVLKGMALFRDQRAAAEGP